MIRISSDFDHGNILCRDAADPSNIQLEIKPDGKADYYQWFYYRVDGAADQPLTMNITNIKGSSYLAGWNDYRAVASYDGEDWFRVDTVFDGNTIKISHTPAQDSVYYAYFAAYPASRYRDFIKHAVDEHGLTHQVIGQTLDGQDIDYLRFGAASGEKKQMWVIARQHPGEDMAAWWMEGFIDALTGGDVATALLEKAVIHVIPCMNLDGVRRGHLRTNAAGVDLNRAWRNTTMELSPEVYLVREKMRETGVDFFMDVHGDEAIPNNFLASSKGIPSWNDRLEVLFERYSELMLEVSEDFQTKDGYPVSPPGRANLDIANNYVAETWGCLSMTLEMPFKDANVNPDPVRGWSPSRCRSFAREHLQAMAVIVGAL